MSDTQAAATMFEELRAPVGFESLYQGVSTLTPIVLCSSANKDGLDQQASQQLNALRAEFRRNGGVYPIEVNPGNGISPFLVAGLPVPLYASVLLQLPAILPGIGSLQDIRYRYRIIWRNRSFQTSANKRNPFHARNASYGAPDDGSVQLSPPPGGAAWSGGAVRRYPMVAAVDSVAYVQTEPAMGSGLPALLSVYEADVIVTRSGLLQNPVFNGIAPGQIARGDVSQGITQNPSNGSKADYASYITRAMGDELVLMIWRPAQGGEGPGGTWDFSPGGADANIPVFFGAGSQRDGTTSSGVLVTTGVAP